MAKRAKRVSKAYGTKAPTKTTRKGLPSKGYRTRGETTRAMSTKKTGVRVLTGQAALFVGRPGFGGRIPGPVDGKLSVKRVMMRDPKIGTELKAADKITSTHVDLIGNPRPTVKMQPLPGSPQAFDNAGRKSIPTPRKSKPVFSNKPGRVRRSPGS
jgi:hypothetical protein